MEIIGPDSLLLLTVFLSLVFLVPVSIPGVSTVFGIGILLSGVTLLFSRHIWLPQKIANRQLSAEKLREGFTRALVWLHRLEKISQPHCMNRLTAEGMMTVLNNLSFIFAAVLLIAPFGFIPFSNTLPALALIFLAVGMMQRDGRFILYGNLSNLAAVIYFGFLILGGGWSVAEFIKLVGQWGLQPQNLS
ncbi:MAG: protein exod [Chloroflexota bacterium]|nr:MAG: protein exod [Chloroflexota bacterium]